MKVCEGDRKVFFEIFNKHLGRQIDALLAARYRPDRPNSDPYTGRNRPFSCFKFKKYDFQDLNQITIILIRLQI